MTQWRKFQHAVFVRVIAHVCGWCFEVIPILESVEIAPTSAMTPIPVPKIIHITCLPILTSHPTPGVR